MDPDALERLTLTPGDLGRATIHDDPTATADGLAGFFPDAGDRAAAVGWLRTVADRLER